jgi:hypothetical protein
MPGKKPNLVTGANAKIKIGTKTVAYATELQFSVNTEALPIEVIGAYEARGHEPVALYVEGSFKILRYANPKEIADAVNGSNITGISDVPGNTNNGIGQWGGNGVNDAGLSAHIKPAELLLSTTTNIEVFTSVRKDVVSDTLSNYLFKIHDVRITRASGSLSKREILEETFTFKALRFSDNSFESSSSRAPG